MNEYNSFLKALRAHCFLEFFVCKFIITICRFIWVLDRNLSQAPKWNLVLTLRKNWSWCECGQVLLKASIGFGEKFRQNLTKPKQNKNQLKKKRKYLPEKGGPERGRKITHLLQQWNREEGIKTLLGLPALSLAKCFSTHRTVRGCKYTYWL